MLTKHSSLKNMMLEKGFILRDLYSDVLAFNPVDFIFTDTGLKSTQHEVLV